jgi:predicted Zn finger-like uncharacterized protein
MILVCPSCRTRYQVDDEAVKRPSGRTVRCANCGHSWQHLEPPAPPPLRRERAADTNPESAVTPVSVTPRPAITAPAPQRQRRRSGLVWVFLILLVGAAVVAIILGRDKIVAHWPGAARYYGYVGLQPEPLGAGLDIAHVSSTRNTDGLIVEGDVTNTTTTPRTVPRLRVALRDGSQRELIFKTIDPPRERLLPGETSHFTAGFLPAPDNAAGVLVTFAAS